MPDGQVLEFSGVTKRFGSVAAVSGLSARVEPGVVTGFLGPNGAGKTTSLRILLGLVRATSGSATIGGVPYAKLRNPLRSVGAVLEASSFHPGRTAANHLKVYAQAAGLPESRVDEALATVGLSEVGGRKVGGYSLGMRQRLGLAYALLGDPGVLVLDEPSNGLDPEGIKWMRGLLRQLARQGRTVLVSSHLLSEVQQSVDALLIISQGRLVFQGALDELSDPSEYAVVVDSPDRAALSSALLHAGMNFDVLRSGLTVRNASPSDVGAVALGAGVALSSLTRRGPALEEIFLDLVSGARVHTSASAVEDPGADVVAGAVEDVAEADAAPVGEVAASEAADAGAGDVVAGDVPAGDVPAGDVDVAMDGVAGTAAAVGIIAADGADAPGEEVAQSEGDEPAEADGPSDSADHRLPSDVEADQFFASFTGEPMAAEAEPGPAPDDEATFWGRPADSAAPGDESGPAETSEAEPDSNEPDEDTSAWAAPSPGEPEQDAPPADAPAAEDASPDAAPGTGDTGDGNEGGEYR